jgi:predicted deacylase
MAVPERTRTIANLSVAPMADGSSLQVPVHILSGAGPGPCLAAVAGVHGDEAEGISALLELSQTLELSSFRGRLLLIPIANPLAFAASQRRTPVDGADLNRLFPGNPSGTLSERLARALFDTVRNNAQFLLTLHGWYATGATLPHVEVSNLASPVRQASYDAAFASGFAYVRASDWSPGLFPAAVNAAGIPAMEAELGGGGRTHRQTRQDYIQYVLALMRHLGMREGAAPEVAAPRRVWRSQHVMPACGGVMISDMPLGAQLRRGDVLGTVSDLTGTPLEELKAPFDGVLMARRQFISVVPGDLAFTVFGDDLTIRTTRDG